MNTEIENQIRQCEERLYKAMLTSDVGELDALIADDLLFAGQTGELATKQMDLELHLRGTIVTQEFGAKAKKVGKSQVVALVRWCNLERY